MDIHFVRITREALRNERKEAIIFLHGWPGSFLEYLDVARLLNASTSSAYDLIIPSLPGFGYSDAAARAGLHTGQIARIMHNLMQRLGYSSYVICGGDWGTNVGTMMAQLYPGHVRGLLFTMIFPSMTSKHYAQLALGHLVSLSILLDHDEQEFLDHRFSAFDLLTFLW